MNHIPIVVLSDNNLNFAVATLFINLLETAHKKTFYELNVLVSPDFKSEYINEIKTLEKKYKHCEIRFIKMDKRFEEAVNRHQYVTNTCLYKMVLAEKFPQYDKILYLDLDLFIKKDLSKIYETDLKDNYIAGFYQFYPQISLPNLHNELNISDLKQYVNAGVLVFNLKAIRENHIEEELQKWIGKFEESVDQHIFNKVCYNKILQLNPLWNITATEDLMFKSDNYPKKEFSNEKILKMRTLHYIYHYTGKDKPWTKNANVKYQKEWFNYGLKTPYKDYILELKKLYLLSLIEKRKRRKRLLNILLRLIVERT